MGKTIMVVDDDEGILDSVTMVLKFKGYEVIFCTDSTAASKGILQHPDLILLDIWLGQHNGIDICRSIKKEESTSHIPVMLMSASKDMKTKALNDGGADDFLEKPFDIFEMERKVEIILAATKKG